MRNKKNDAMSAIGEEQQRLLKTLRSEVSDAQSLLKLVAASQDPQAVSRDQMEFLGIVGSRMLSPEESKLAEQGISIDDLRRICGRKIEESQRNNSLRDSLPPNHLLRIVYAEHDLLLYFLYDLMNLVAALGKMPDWTSCHNETEKMTHIMGHLCTMDAHQVREEQVILPQLLAHHCGDMPTLIFGEHKRLHHQRVAIKEFIDTIDTADFVEWRSGLDDVIREFVPATREHIYKEEHILYPDAIKLIPDPQVWEDMKSACDKLGLCCF
jgi:uncharacterized protein